MVRLTLSAVAIFVLGSLSSSCSATRSEHLRQYRDGAVRHLVASQTGRSVEEIGRDSPKIVILQPLVHFQVDAVDRSQVTFRITGEKRDTQSGLYIREIDCGKLFINFIGCKGALADELNRFSGAGKTVEKSELL